MSGSYWDKVTRNRVTRRRLLRTGAAFSAAAAALALVGCGDDDDAPSSTATGAPAATSAPGDPTATPASGSAGGGDSFTPSSGPPQGGGKFAFQSFVSENFNPVANWLDATSLGGAHVFDRPITSREDERRFVLEAMESIELPDDTTVVMKLKPGQTYHDISPVSGRPLVAQDIVSSQEYAAALPQAFDKTFHNDFLEMAEAPDDVTVIYHLKKPNAYLFSQNMLGSGTGQPIMAPETLDNIDSATQVGTGPYQVERVQLGVNHLWKKFPNFREASKGLPYLEQREAKIIADLAAAEAAFRSGQIDRLATPTPTQVQTLPGDMGDKVQLHSRPGLAGNYWHLNMTRDFPWQTDPRVRQAFWRLTNRQQMLELAYAGDGVLPAGVLPAGLVAYQLDPSAIEDFYAEDPEEAVKLLTAAEFDLEQEFDMMASQAGSATDQQGQVWQQQLSRAGIKTSISTVTAPSELFQRWAENDWDIMVQGSPGTDTPGQTLRNQHSAGWSDVYRGFALFDDEIDALIEQSEITLDFEENVRLVTEVQMLCLERYTSSYLAITQNSNFVLSGRLQNFDLTQVAPAYRLELWVAG